MESNGWVEWYEDLLKNRDPRTVGWFMVGSPFEGILICLCYVVLVAVIGPRYMKHREPFNIRPLMAVYNLVMVVLSAYMVYEFLLGGWLYYSFGCELMDPTESPRAMRMVHVCYLFYLSKFVELLDTVFFVMRKKFQLVTFLHVFHHSIMPCSWWIAVKFSPGGMGTFHALANSFVHVWMYTYYGIAAMGPRYQKFLWWKKYLTIMQMVQFVAVALHTSQILLTDCPYPKLFGWWILAYACFFQVLFTNFYVQAYIKKRNQKRKQRDTVANGTHVSNGVANGISNGSIGDVSHKNGYVKNGAPSGGLKED